MMYLRRITIAFTFGLILTQAYGQSSKSKQKDSIPTRKFFISSPWLSFDNFGAGNKNIHHYELHVKCAVTPKDRIGIKFATWRLFQPMGILWWEGLLDKIETESEFYPGRLWEKGAGITYQRILWKGLFATVEVLPQVKTYLDENKNKIGTGFKLYTSYHLGYHLSFFKDRMYIEPQIHCNYWPIDTNTPQAFKVLDNKWHNYFLLEPNLYIGVKF